MSAAHIIPVKVDPSIINYICPGRGTRLFTADNALYINDFAYKAFDSHCFVIFPVDPEEVPITRYKIIQTGNHAKTRWIGVKRLEEANHEEL